jgi:hypothetical protein
MLTKQYFKTLQMTYEDALDAGFDPSDDKPRYDSRYYDSFKESELDDLDASVPNCVRDFYDADAKEDESFSDWVSNTDLADLLTYLNKD